MNLIQRLSEDALAIFLFHGVIERSNYTVRNYTKKHLEKDQFYQIMSDLKKRGYPLSMDEVIKHHNESEPFPSFAFAVTFDDGFENNYSIAAPILSDLGIPATFYLTTDFIENNHMSWIDRIEYCLESMPQGQLSFPWAENSHLFRNAEEKVRLLDYLRNRVKQDKRINVDILVSDIFNQCGIQEIKKSDDPLDLKMSWEQVRELGSDNNFIVGAHTHNHVILAFLSENALESEVKTSIDLLGAKIGVRPRHYSYPEGLEHCYSDEVVNVLMSHGVVCCPTAEDGINRMTDSLFHLKRIAVV